MTVAAFVLRVAVTLVTKGRSGASLDQGDAFYYSAVANHMGFGHWFVNPFTLAPAADHPPLTIVVLTPASWLFASALAQRLTMVLIGTLTVSIIGLVGRRIGGETVGIVAALLALLNPNLWINDSLVMSESLAACLIAILIWIGVALAKQPRPRLAAAAGIATGLAVLTRPELGWFFVLMVVPILASVRGLDLRRRLALVVLAGACMGAVIAPWTLLNTSRFDRVVWVSNNSGGAIAGANCSATYSGELIGAWDPSCATRNERPRLDASRNAERGMQSGLSFARHHLSRLPAVVIAREARMFGFFRPQMEVDVTVFEGRPRGISWAAFSVFWCLIPPSIAGALTLARRRETLWPFIACLGAPVLTAALFYGIPRLRLPLDVAMCLLAAIPIATWWTRRTHRDATVTALPAG